MGEFALSVFVVALFAVAFGAVIWVPLLWWKSGPSLSQTSLGAVLEVVGFLLSLIAIGGIASNHLGHFVVFIPLTAFFFRKLLLRFGLPVVHPTPVLMFLAITGSMIWVGWNHWPV